MATDNRERLIRDLGSALFPPEKTTYAALPWKTRSMPCAEIRAPTWILPFAEKASFCHSRRNALCTLRVSHGGGITDGRAYEVSLKNKGTEVPLFL